MFNRAERIKAELDEKKAQKIIQNGWDSDVSFEPAVDELATRLSDEIAVANGYRSEDFEIIRGRNISGRSIEEVMGNIKAKTGPCDTTWNRRFDPVKAPMNVAEIEEQEKNKLEAGSFQSSFYALLEKERDAIDAMLKAINSQFYNTSPLWNRIKKEAPKKTPPLPPLKKIQFVAHFLRWEGGPKDGHVEQISADYKVYPSYLIPVYTSYRAFKLTYPSVNLSPIQVHRYNLDRAFTQAVGSPDLYSITYVYLYEGIR